AEHPDLGMSLVNLGSVQWMQAKFAAVETNFEEALRLYKKRGNQPAVSLLQANLATVLARKGELAAARELHEQTLTLRRRLFKGDHRNVEVSLTQLGLVLVEQGEIQAAEGYFKEALAMEERLHLGRHPDLADTLAGLGEVLAKKGDWTAAQEKHRQALDIRIEVLKGEANPDVVDSLDALGVLAIARDELEVAQATLLRAEQAAKKSEPADFPTIIAPLWHLGWVLEQLGEMTGAAQRRSEALAICSKHGVFGVWPMLLGIYDLTDVLEARGKFAEAEPLLLGAAAQVRGEGGIGATLKRSICVKLSRFYEAWDRAVPGAGKSAHALVWRQKLGELPGSTN
ncbi:MAG: tetratricopeptide repeat protein, partial [Verrucomicrobia bacterium]|nr:tetratricopeptide repeat protein [Verrucomicrobiota bacterium]